jgi:hypothetical protein
MFEISLSSWYYFYRFGVCIIFFNIICFTIIKHKNIFIYRIKMSSEVGLRLSQGTQGKVKNTPPP